MPQPAAVAFAAAASAALLTLTGCGGSCPVSKGDDAATPASVTSPETTTPARAEDARPLQRGAKAPAATLRAADGATVDLAAAYADKPTVLVFYRGGWCPYCNTHLGQLAQVEPELVEAGYQVFAISPDRPEAMKATDEKGDFAYRLLSDSDMALARGFGLAFRVDDETVEKYKGYGIDLEQASGEKHHELPVPAVYVIDTAGVVRFAHADADYKQRLDPQAILAAARDAAK